jgi:tetratricopeptide (TPR) repeat protein
MGQTAEDIRDNIVKIADENGNCVGTGFFIHKEYCVTCHHNICRLNEIYVEREEDPEKGGKKRRYPAEWVEEFSNMRRDIAFIKVKGADFKPLQYGRQTYGKMPVVLRGFPLEDLYHYPDDKDESGKLSSVDVRFVWEQEEIGEKTKKWNVKPKVNVQVFTFGADFSGKFDLGFSGAPVYHEYDGIVVGLFEAKDATKGYVIPMNVVIQKFDLEERGRKVSAPLPTLDTKTILDKGNAYFYKREYLKAIEQYDKILDDSNYAAALNNKGWALGKLRKYKEAIAYYDKAIEIDPNYVDALDNKGWALYHLARYEEAIEQFDKTP